MQVPVHVTPGPAMLCSTPEAAGAPFPPWSIGAAGCTHGEGGSYCVQQALSTYLCQCRRASPCECPHPSFHSVPWDRQWEGGRAGKYWTWSEEIRGSGFGSAPGSVCDHGPATGSASSE